MRNVVVSCKHRRQGIGNILMAAAADMAKQEWGSTGMCAHVSAQNDVRPLYPSEQASLILGVFSCAMPTVAKWLRPATCAVQAAIALYEACGYHEVSQETISSGMPATGGSLLGENPGALQRGPWTRCLMEGDCLCMLAQIEICLLYLVDKQCKPVLHHSHAFEICYICRQAAFHGGAYLRAGPRWHVEAQLPACCCFYVWSYVC